MPMGVIVALLLVALPFVVVACMLAILRSLSRFRLGVVFEGVAGTQ